MPLLGSSRLRLLASQLASSEWSCRWRFRQPFDSFARLSAVADSSPSQRSVIRGVGTLGVGRTEVYLLAARHFLETLRSRTSRIGPMDPSHSGDRVVMTGIAWTVIDNHLRAAEDHFEASLTIIETAGSSVPFAAVTRASIECAAIATWLFRRPDEPSRTLATLSKLVGEESRDLARADRSAFRLQTVVERRARIQVLHEMSERAGLAIPPDGTASATECVDSLLSAPDQRSRFGDVLYGGLSQIAHAAPFETMKADQWEFDLATVTLWTGVDSRVHHRRGGRRARRRLVD